MSQIFLSYSRTDIDHAKRIADALGRRGWSVWWDSNLQAGQTWEREIEKNLELASCVVVLWSHSSVESQWVRAEAQDAFRRGILIPARISEVNPPLIYRTIQTIDLMSWLAKADDNLIAKLLAGVGLVLQRASGSPETGQWAKSTLDAAVQPEGIEAKSATGARVADASSVARKTAKPGGPRRLKTQNSRPGVRRAQPKSPKRGAVPERAPITAHTVRKVFTKLQVASAWNDRVNTLRSEAPWTSNARSRSERSGPSRDVFTNVFIQLDGTSDPPRVVDQKSRQGDIAYAHVRLSDLGSLTADPSVVAVESADPIVLGHVQVGSLQARRPQLTAGLKGMSARSADILIGIIDIGGFDFAHPDFLDDDGRTRFLRIWDQGGHAHPPPERFRFGSEIKQQHMNSALSASARIGLAAQELEPQSQMVPGSRATHLASVAAGSVGLCPQAPIAGVVLPQRTSREGRVLCDSSSIARAVDYLFDLAVLLNKPVSIAIGVSTQSPTHDASTGIARWVDAALGRAGRYLCVGANEAPQPIPDVVPSWESRFGRIHTRGTIRDEGLTERIEWVINGNGQSDLCEHELHLWYDRQDRFAFEIRPPDASWIGPIEVGESVQNQVLEDGTVVGIYHERFAPTGGSNHIACFLSPFFSATGVSGVRAGTWIVRLHGREVRNGSYQGWIARDDARNLGDNHVGLSLPSYFSRRSSVPGFTITGLACARRVLTVANLDPDAEVIHPSSAKGPTREGYEKPELAVVGTGVVAANGFDAPNPPWIAMTGTSVAAAFAAGTAGLMLAIDPRLSAREITEIVTRRARPLPGADYGWHDDSGFGCLDVLACLHETREASSRKTVSIT